MKAALRELLETVLLALIIFLAVRSVVQNFKVEGSSMEPNLHTGEYLLVNKAVYLSFDLSPLTEGLPLIGGLANGPVFPFHPPQRGEVVVFRFPKDPSRDFIKRVIGTPGETVEVKGGKVYIDGTQLSEPYIYEAPNYSLEPELVPPDHYFVLGDNRNSSSDSRIWGMVPRENIVGKAWFTYWPMNSWGLVPNYPLAAKGSNLGQ